MKPIKLIISAFGPYPEEMPPVMFDKFEERGLFLIAGDTGAGKTTIFDAISFALFGTSSGSYREIKCMRCETASAKTESFVDFYFSHQGREYRIKRWVPYERINRNGKPTTEPEKAELYRDGAPIADGKKNVDALIPELLHVSAKQFKQISMIAQGEFWNLLNAKTAERTEILRNIFETGGYKNIEQKLKDRLDAAKKEKERTEILILRDFEDVSCGENSLISGELSELKEKAVKSKSAWNCPEFLSIIERLLAEDESFINEADIQYKKADELYSQMAEAVTRAENDNLLLKKVCAFEEEKRLLEEKKPEMDALFLKLEKASAASAVKPEESILRSKEKSEKDLKESLLRSEERAKAAENEKEAAKERNIKALLRADEALELRSRAAGIEADREKYSQRDELRRKTAFGRKTVDALKRKEAEHLEKERVLADRIAKLAGRVEELKSKPEEKSALEIKYDNFKSLKQEAEAYSDKYISEYRKRITDLSEKQSELIKAEQRYDAALTERRTGEKILDGCRAGLLAMELAEDSPCPVCGSRSHPNPAKLPSESISEETVKKLREAEEVAGEERANASETAASAKSKLSSAENYLRDGLALLLSKEPFSYSGEGQSVRELILAFENSLGVIEAYEKKILSELASLNKLCSELSECREAFAKASGEERDALSKEGKEIAEKKAAEELSLREAEAKLEAFESLPYENLAEADAALKKIHTAIAEIDGEIEKTAGEKAEKEKAFSEIRGRIVSLEENLSGAEKERAAAAEDFLSAMRAAGFEGESDYRACLLPEEVLIKLKKQIEEYRALVGSIDAKLDEARKNAEGKVPADTEALISQRDGQKAEREALAAKKNSIENRYSENRKRLAAILGKQAEYESAVSRTAICERLYKLVTGQTGAGKITLEQFVQANGFDRIIRAANRRLLPMSDNQFELRRQESSIGKQSGNFLDLEVFDNWTGRSRPVGNLSGGESFKASLALALGLSDTVSSSRGGIQMDALFIDEGFGTLDKKSIENAIDILVNLAGTNKLVGIISHREELNEIPQKIIVTKTKSGSKMRFEGVV